MIIGSYQNSKIFLGTGKIENGIWDSVEKHGRFVVGIHSNSELTGNIT